jgi:DNA adenine methylase
VTASTSPIKPVPSNRNPITPFLKWPGGKRWLAPVIADLVRSQLSGTYYEPFVGGGAVFFQLQPSNAVLSDINHDLISTYLEVREHTIQLIDRVKRFPVSERDYYEIRASNPAGALDRAARFLYLNRTAFGGIYRLNQRGQFNVPYGRDRTPEPLWRNKLLETAAPALQSAELIVSDFQTTIERAGVGDVVYCDPTYTVAHNNNGFQRYNERNFAWRDQERLATVAWEASKRGATVIVSNALHESVADLYIGAEARQVLRSNMVSTDPRRRGQVGEYLFVIRPTSTPSAASTETTLETQDGTIP